MATYNGKSAEVNRPIGELYSRFSDLSSLSEAIEAKKDRASEMGEIKVDGKSLSIVNPQVGEIKFEVVDCVEPTKVVYKAVSSPLPLAMTINLQPVGDSVTSVSTSIDIDLPVMMRALLGSKLQQVADKFGEAMTGMI